MHAYLIMGGTMTLRAEHIQKQLTEAHISVFDTVYLTLEAEGEHIGIDAVRAFKKQLLLAPQHSKHTAGVIQTAHTLTVEAQNALLKLLEEPPPHAILYAETENPDLLLPTIVSRCTVVRVVDSSETTVDTSGIQNDITLLLTESVGKKLTRIEAYTKDRITAKNWTQQALTEARHRMIALSQTGNHEEINKITMLIRRLLQAQRELAVNVNPRLVIDCVFLAS